MATEDEAVLDDSGAAAEVEELAAEAETPPEGTIEAEDGVESLSKQLKDTQRKLHELATQNAEFRGKLSMVKAPSADEPPADILDAYTEDQLMANPGLAIKAMKEMRANLLDQVASVIQHRDGLVEERLRQVDPERVMLRAEVEALKQDEDYAKLPEESLYVIAKKQRGNGSGRKNPPSALPGGRSAGGGAAKPADVRSGNLYQRIYGTEFLPKEVK